MEGMLAVFFGAMLPVTELRLTIPAGLANGLPLGLVLFWSILGNGIIVLPLLLFFDKFLHWAVRLPLVGKIAKWWFNRVEQKSETVRKYGFYGLIFFVAIPLPGSGVWSGSLIASLLEMDIRKSLLACLIGVILAAIIVTAASLGVLSFIG